MGNTLRLCNVHTCRITPSFDLIQSMWQKKPVTVHSRAKNKLNYTKLVARSNHASERSK